MPTAAALHDYRRRAELYGPELVVETAAYERDERELAELQSYVRHLERTKRWHRGRLARHAGQRTALRGVRA